VNIELPRTKDEEICILVVGDLAFPGLPSIQTHTFDGLYANDVLEALHDKDISSANLECPLTTINNPISKSGPNLSAYPKAVEALKLAKFDVAILANNHIMDHGETALQETISVCEKADLKTVGVGANLEAAYHPLHIEVKGHRIAFLAFAEEEFSCATSETPGAAKLDLAMAGTVIRETKKRADLVIVSVHGGNEFYPVPSPRIQSWYRFLVECGADAVIGHHPHTVQGIEIYKNVPIVYSLGNFIFPAKTKLPKCWYEGLLLRLTIGRNRICGVELFPCKQVVSGDNNIRIELLKGQARERFSKRLDRLTEIASDPFLVREFWKCFCTYRRKTYINSLKTGTATLPSDWLLLVKNAVANKDLSFLAGIGSDITHYLCQRKSVKQRQIHTLRNFLVCPSHQEVLSTIIEMKRLGQKPPDAIWLEFEKLMVYCNRDSKT